MAPTNRRTAFFSLATVLCVAAPWLNPVSSGPMPGLYPLVFSWACVALFLAITAFELPEKSAISNGWMVAGLLSCIIALFQFSGHSVALGALASQVQAGEAFGNLRQRNQFASLCNIALAAALFGWSNRSATDEKIFRGAVIALALIAGAASGSRTGLVQVLILVLVFLMWSDGTHRQKLVRMGTVIAVYACGLILLAVVDGRAIDSIGIVARISDTTDACHSRLTLWSNVLHLISLRPWTGWGWSELGYAHYVTLYPDTRFCEILDNAHNLPLQLAVELGIPFACLACALLAFAVWKMRPWAEKDRSRQLAWAVLLVIGIHSLLEYPMWYGPFQMAAMLCVYLLLPPRVLAARTNISPLKWQLVVSICLLIGSGYAAWDYRRISQVYLPVESRDAAYRTDTLEKIASSRVFRNQVEFAELMTTLVTPASAPRLYILSHRMLHFSAEPTVIEKAIETSRALGLVDEANFHIDHYKAAFPQAYEKWLYRS